MGREGKMKRVTCSDFECGNKAIQIVALLATVTLAVLAMKAQTSSGTPVGRWRTFSDVTGKESGAVEIVEKNGELEGRLIAGSKPNFDTRVCDLCPGDRYQKPMKGLLVISGVRRKGDEWGGGEILDPDVGKIYRVKLRVTEGGKKLLVRGYIGFSLLGRTQTWVRME
jgi:uncharacterized protein (DUF2147 family)